MKTVAVGILAHVDSGKTTLSEALMYTSGNLKKFGRVDHGDAFLDTYALERERGITIFSKQAILRTENAVFTLLDTPGHVDFSAETERTLQVLDYAVLVISGPAGVQSHTLTLWKLLRRYNVPVFIFVNKTDLPGAEKNRLMLELRGRLSDSCVDFTRTDTESFYESAAMCSEALLEEYTVTGRVETKTLAAAIRARRLFPCMFGAALKLTGVEEFLRCLGTYTEMPAYGEAFGAKVYKISQDPQGARLTFLKVTGGALRVRETLPGEQNTAGEKVNQIRLYSGEKFVSADVAPAGTVCAVTGITFAKPGDGLGAERDTGAPVLEPVLSYSVQLPPGTDTHAALEKLKRLEAEDPLLDVRWDPRTGEVRLRLMGEIQLEVLQKLIVERFGLQVTFGRGSIIYKETIAAPVEGVGHFEPLRHYAEVHLLMKPGPPNSGLRFGSACREDLLDKNWQRLILTHLYEKTHLGVLTGAPITDMEITLASGRAHPKHTEGGDFRQATYRAVRQGLRMAESVLLEPVYDFVLEVPSENIGRAMADIRRMSGTPGVPETVGDATVLSGTAPASEMSDYAKELAHYTRGRGKLTCTLSGYAPCHNAEEVIAAAGYDPDADTENPCDSVFCSHGAGHTVKWNEVPGAMHLPSALEPPKPAAAPAQPRPVSSGGGNKRDIFALDKELMAIYERTYGQVKSRSDPAESAPRSFGVPKQPKPRPVPTFTGKEYVLVDGYNVIYAWNGLRELSAGSMADARDSLIRILCNYRGFRQCELILVFDAYKVPGGDREIETVGGISVVYTKEAETADMYIERVSHTLAKDNRVRVVTSDGMEQVIILGNGALRVSAEAFYAEILQTQREIRDAIDGKPYH